MVDGYIQANIYTYTYIAITFNSYAIIFIYIKCVHLPKREMDGVTTWTRIHPPRRIYRSSFTYILVVRISVKVAR